MPAVTYSPFWGDNVEAYKPLTSLPVGYEAVGALFNALIGASPGGTVSSSHARVGQPSARCRSGCKQEHQRVPVEGQ